MIDGYYIDSSALVKRYINETGSRSVDALFQRRLPIITAAFTYFELYACFGRLHRLGHLRRPQLTALAAAFEQDWHAFTIVEMTEPVRARAPKLAASTALRGGDLAQLTAAQAALEFCPHLVFVAADTVLLNAARDHDLAVLDPTDPDS